MRVLLFPSYRGGGFGHVSRCLALAEELKRQGWEVAFVLGSTHAERVAKAGWTVFRPPAPPSSPLRRLLGAALRRLRPSPAFLFFSELSFQALRDGFQTPESVQDAVAWELSVVHQFRADVLVGDVWLLTSILGRLAGLPVVQIVRSALHPADPQLVWWCDLPAELRAPDVAPVFNPALAQWGLPPIQQAEDLLDGDLLLVPSIPELDPLPPDAALTHYVGPLVRPTTGNGSQPDWMTELPDNRPIIYVTVGGGSDAVRELNLLPFWENAFAETDWEVVVSTGGRPVAARWQARGNLRAFPWVPGAAMVTRADAVLFHGGYGTLMETVQAGVPSVVLPFHTEQEGNGRRLEASGLARVVLPSTAPYQVTLHRWNGGEYTVLTQPRLDLSPTALREAVRIVLTDTSYRDNARRLSRELSHYGAAAQAVELIGSLLA